jgi:hypothetical protein
MTSTLLNRLNVLRVVAALAMVGVAQLAIAESTMIGSVQDIPPGHIVVSVSTELMTAIAFALRQRRERDPRLRPASSPSVIRRPCQAREPD